MTIIRTYPEAAQKTVETRSWNVANQSELVTAIAA